MEGKWNISQNGNTRQILTNNTNTRQNQCHKTFISKVVKVEMGEMFVIQSSSA